MTAVIILCKPEIAQKETGAREFVICNMKPRLEKEKREREREQSALQLRKQKSHIIRITSHKLRLKCTRSGTLSRRES